MGSRCLTTMFRWAECEHLASNKQYKIRRLNLQKCVHRMHKQTRAHRKRFNRMVLFESNALNEKAAQCRISNVECRLCRIAPMPLVKDTFCWLLLFIYFFPVQKCCYCHSIILLR